MAIVSPIWRPQNPQDGATYPNGEVRFYESRSSRGKHAYTDSALKNGIYSIGLNQQGFTESPIFLGPGLYQVRVYRSSDVGDPDASPRFTLDDVSGTQSLGESAEARSARLSGQAFSFLQRENLNPDSATSAPGPVQRGGKPFTETRIGTDNVAELLLWRGELTDDLAPGEPLFIRFGGLFATFEFSTPVLKAPAAFASQYTSSIDRAFASNIFKAKDSAFIRFTQWNQKNDDGETEYYDSVSIGRDPTRSGAFSSSSQTSYNLSELNFVVQEVPRPVPPTDRVSAPLSVWRKGQPYEIYILREWLPGQGTGFDDIAGLQRSDMLIGSTRSTFSGKASITMYQPNQNVALPREAEKLLAQTERAASRAETALAAQRNILEDQDIDLSGLYSTEGYVPYWIDYRLNEANNRYELYVSAWGQVVGDDIRPVYGILPLAWFGDRQLISNSAFSRNFAVAFSGAPASFRLLVKTSGAAPSQEDENNADGRFVIKHVGSHRYVEITDSAEGSGITNGFIKTNGRVSAERGEFEAIGVQTVVVPRASESADAAQIAIPSIPPTIEAVRNSTLQAPSVEFSFPGGETGNADREGPWVPLRTLEGSGDPAIATISNDKIKIENNGVYSFLVNVTLEETDDAGYSHRWVGLRLNGTIVGSQQISEDVHGADDSSPTREQVFSFHTAPRYFVENDLVDVSLRVGAAEGHGGGDWEYRVESGSTIRVTKYNVVPTGSADAATSIDVEVSHIIGTGTSGDSKVDMSSSLWSYSTDGNRLNFSTEDSSSNTLSDGLRAAQDGIYHLRTYGTYGSLTSRREKRLRASWEVTDASVEDGSVTWRDLCGSDHVDCLTFFLRKGQAIRLNEWDSTDLSAVHAQTNDRLHIEISSERVVARSFNPNKFTDLTDTVSNLNPTTVPTGTSSDVFLRVNPGKTGVDLATLPAASGGRAVTMSTQLTDMPSSLTGQQRKMLVVSDNEDRYQLVDQPTGGRGSASLDFSTYTDVSIQDFDNDNDLLLSVSGAVRKVGSLDLVGGVFRNLSALTGATLTNHRVPVFDEHGVLNYASAGAFIEAVDVNVEAVTVRDALQGLVGAEKLDGGDLRNIVHAVSWDMATGVLGFQAKDGNAADSDVSVNLANYLTQSRLPDSGVLEGNIGAGQVSTRTLADRSVTLDKMAKGTAGRLLGYNQDGDPAEVEQNDDENYAVPYSYISQLQGTDAVIVSARFVTERATGEIFVNWQTDSLVDDAGLGFGTRASTDVLQFAELSSTQDTYVRFAGKLRVGQSRAHAPVSGQFFSGRGIVEVYMLEYESTAPTTPIGDPWLLATVGVSKKTDSTDGIVHEIPVVFNSQVRPVRGGRLYRVRIKVTQNDRVNIGARWVLLNSAADLADLISVEKVEAPFSVEDASTTQKGVIEIATAAEGTTGTDGTKAMTPVVSRAVGDQRYRQLTEKIQTADIQDGAVTGDKIRNFSLAPNTKLYSDTRSSEDRVLIVERLATHVNILPLSNFLTFRQVSTLPLPTALGQRYFLTDHDHGHVPGYYESYANPDQHRNRTVATIAADPLASNVNGFKLEPSNTFGAADDHTQAGGMVWSTRNPRYLNLFVSSLFSNRPTIYARFSSTEFSSDVTRLFRFNQGTTSANFNSVDGTTFRAFAVDNTEIDSSGDVLIQRLQELEDASGDNKINIDLYSDSAGTIPLNFKPEFLIRPYFGQVHLKESLEEPKYADRIISGEKVLQDWNQLKNYKTLAEAQADDAFRANYQFTVGDDAQRVTDRELYIVKPGFPPTGGSKGAANHRNRFSALLTPMGDGDGYYWTANQPANKRKFNNVISNADVDPNNRIGSVSFFGREGGLRERVQIGIDPTSYTNASLFVNIQRRVRSVPGSTPRALPGLSLDVNRVTGANATSNFGGVARRNYLYTLTPSQSTSLGTGGWLFDDDVVLLDFKTSVNGNNWDFNPDEVQYTSGTGYVAPSGKIDPAASKIESGGGGSKTPTKIEIRTSTQGVIGGNANGRETTLATLSLPSGIANNQWYQAVATFSLITNNTEVGNRVWVEARLLDGRNTIARMSQYVRHLAANQFEEASFNLVGIGQRTTYNNGANIRLQIEAFCAYSTTHGYLTVREYQGNSAQSHLTITPL